MTTDGSSMWAGNRCGDVLCLIIFLNKPDLPLYRLRLEILVLDKNFEMEIILVKK